MSFAGRVLRFQVRWLRLQLRMLRALREARRVRVVVKTIRVPDDRPPADVEMQFGREWWGDRTAEVDASFAETMTMAGRSPKAAGRPAATTKKTARRAARRRRPRRPTAKSAEDAAVETPRTVTHGA